MQHLGALREKFILSVLMRRDVSISIDNMKSLDYIVRFLRSYLSRANSRSWLIAMDSARERRWRPAFGDRPHKSGHEEVGAEEADGATRVVPSDRRALNLEALEEKLGTMRLKRFKSRCQASPHLAGWICNGR